MQTLAACLTGLEATVTPANAGVQPDSTGFRHPPE